MNDLQTSPALVASGDFYVGGLNWKDHGLRQVIVGLSEDEAKVLSVAGRLERLAAAGGQKARPTILPPVGQGAPRLLLTGTDVSLDAIKDELGRMLGKDARSVPIHPHDAALLRKPTRIVADLEAQSGCRMVLEDQQKLRLPDPIVTPRHTRVRLFGDASSQARALGLLAPHLQHSDTPLKDTTLALDYANACEDWLSWKNNQGQGGSKLPLETFFCRLPTNIGTGPVHLAKDASIGGPGNFYSFDPTIIGEGLELPPAQVVNSVVRQRFTNFSGHEKAPLQGLVVAGKGQLLPYMMGGFFALKVLKMDLNRVSQGGHKLGIPRGGTRIGVSSAHPKAPAPSTLLSKPQDSWVLGRGFVRGPDGKTSRCKAADVDDAVAEGDELGLLVTKNGGAIALFRRPNRWAEWTCLAHWDAKVDQSKQCFAWLELSGQIVEVELLHGRQAPSSIERDIDTVHLPKRVWP